MAMLRLNLSRLSDTIRDAVAKGTDFAKSLKIIRQLVIYKSKENFDKVATPDGAAWPPLKHPRPNSKGSDLPLNDTGLLRTSISTPGAAGNIDVQESDRIEWGTNLDYGPIHQYGGVITPKVAKLLAIPATVAAQDIGSPRNWPEGSLVFKFKDGGRYGRGVATDMKGEVQYYFAAKAKIPAREFLGITNEQATQYAEIAAEAAADNITKGLVGQ